MSFKIEDAQRPAPCERCGKEAMLGYVEFDDGEGFYVCEACRLSLRVDALSPLCDVCDEAVYPGGRLPEEGELRFGWCTVVHPIPSMDLEEGRALSLCCDQCVKQIYAALGLPPRKPTKHRRRAVN